VAERLAGHSDQVARLFDRKASTWSQKYAPGGRLTDRLAQVSTALDGYVQAKGRILDLGCGAGHVANAMAAARMQVTGCDISPEMLRRASEQDVGCLVDWVQLETAWQTLPFAAGTFDAIVATSVFEYVDNPSAVLGECARLLRPGGILVCTVPDLTHPVRWAEWAIRLPASKLGGAIPGRLWPHLANYLAYLQTSRNRHFAGWWSATAGRCGLKSPSCAPSRAARTPLRMLTFRRPGESASG
jgi:SAM-dependent methyltransferase